MSYQVLARKWRPRNFREMVGQEHVLRALINALDNDRLHHAYLFTGTRGVGKTTIARIFAKSLNCEEGIGSTPCGVCSTCREVDEGRFIDLIEVDAASRTKVEDTRELLDNVQYAPSRGRFKVYLIDEVHMLSGHSFNALLKTLEEPPPHVKFLLATTDPQKLPVTILSRCLQFSLKRMHIEQIQPHLQHILEQEGIAFEAAALLELARSADGSMRDALSLLDQAIAFGGGDLKASDVHTMLGSIDRGQVYEVLDALIQQDGKLLLQVIEQLAQQAPDFAGVLAAMITVLHNLAILQVVEGAEVGDIGERERLAAMAKTLSPEDVQLYYQIALTGRRDLPMAPDGRSGFEMVLLRMLAFRPATLGSAPPAKPGGLAPGKPEVAPARTPAAEAKAVLSVSPVTAVQSTQASVPIPAQISEQRPPSESKPQSELAHSPDAVSVPTIPPRAEQALPVQEAQPNVVGSLFEEPTIPASLVSKEDSRQDDAASTEGLFQRVDSILDGVSAAAVETGAENKLPSDLLSSAQEEVAQSTSAPSMGLVAENWADIVQMLPLNGMTRQFALNCAFRSEQDGVAELLLATDKAHLLNNNFQQRLEEALSSYYGKSIKLRVELSATISSETPSEVDSRRKAARLQQAQEAIAADANVRAMIDGFDAEVQMSSIQPID
ncbi:MAG: DNA polymerase III subunit gamma/tau [Gammaproteobacteria bacterium]|nr:DNA polymerase III subunit gamma/tau [Gammaproteobacteria bacterium]